MPAAPGVHETVDATGARREFVFGSAALWALYHHRRSEIEREWHGAPACVREAVHRDLRTYVREAVSLGFGGGYLIPV